MCREPFLIATSSRFRDTEAIDLVIRNRSKEVEILKTDPEKAFWNKSRFLFHQKFRRELKANPKKKFYNMFSLEDLIEESKIDPSQPQDIINQGNAMKDHNTYDNLHEIKNETFLLAVSHDRLIPLTTMQEMKEKIQNSKLRVIKNAGHFMTLSRVSEINQIILDFLSG